MGRRREWLGGIAREMREAGERAELENRGRRKGEKDRRKTKEEG